MHLLLKRKYCMLSSLYWAQQTVSIFTQEIVVIAHTILRDRDTHSSHDSLPTGSFSQHISYLNLCIEALRFSGPKCMELSPIRKHHLYFHTVRFSSSLVGRHSSGFIHWKRFQNRWSEKGALINDTVQNGVESIARSPAAFLY
jgi:hypothetical protein